MSTVLHSIFPSSVLLRLCNYLNFTRGNRGTKTTRLKASVGLESLHTAKGTLNLGVVFLTIHILRPFRTTHIHIQRFLKHSKQQMDLMKHVILWAWPFKFLSCLSNKILIRLQFGPIQSHEACFRVLMFIFP